MDADGQAQPLRMLRHCGCRCLAGGLMRLTAAEELGPFAAITMTGNSSIIATPTCAVFECGNASIAFATIYVGSSDVSRDLK